MLSVRREVVFSLLVLAGILLVLALSRAPAPVVMSPGSLSHFIDCGEGVGGGNFATGQVCR